jgi:hypothetical protein
LQHTSLIVRVIVTLILLSFGSLARAQGMCQSNWIPAFGVPSPDGTDGSVRASAVFDDGHGPALYVAGSFAQAGGHAGNIQKWTGGMWLPVGSVNGPVYALAVYNNALYVGGAFTQAGNFEANNLVKWDGSNWSSVGSGLSGGSSGGPNVMALTTYDDGTGAALYVGGNFWYAGGVAVDNVARWNGSSWAGVGSGLGGSGVQYVSSLTTWNSGLYAGGYFNYAGSQLVNGIAKWSGGVWSPLGSGVGGSNPTVTSIAGGIVGDSKSALYVGGTFTSAGGVMANRIAKWSGSAWSAVGSGLNGQPDDLVVNAKVLYACGQFTTAGGIAASRIARWNGTSWFALGSGANGEVCTIAFLNNPTGAGLYAGGAFSSIGGGAASNIAKWQSATWSPLRDPAVDGEVRALLAFDDGTGPALYAGGGFATAGGATVNHVAKWNGTSWSPLGSGFDGDVYAFAVVDWGWGKRLYAGGSFTHSGVASTAHVAEWNATTSTWNPIGVGTDGVVRALAAYNDGSGPALYAGGDFATVGSGTSAKRIAKWNNGYWSPLANDPVDQNNVRALSAFDDGTGMALYVGSSFTGGGADANSLMRWNGSSWTLMGTPFGPSGGVLALAGFDDGSGPSMFAGGWADLFDYVSGALVKWTGTQLVPVGWLQGYDEWVRGLAVFDDGCGPVLYFALEVAHATDNPYLVKWDGTNTTWSIFHSDGFPDALAVFDDGRGPALYAGGSLTAGSLGFPGYDANILKWGRH